MTNELVTIFGTDNYDELAAMTGASMPSSTVLPRLKINREAEDDTGNSVPVGTYSVSQDGMVFYGKPAKFRPFLQVFQYSRYDEAEKAFTNRSIFIKGFNEEAHDEEGGLRCGKVSRDAFEQMDKVAQADQRRIKCYRVLFGTVTLDNAVAADGSKHTVKDVPVQWRMTGDNFNSPKDSIAKIAKMRHLLFQHNLVLNTQREKKGSNVYYISLIEPNIKEIIPFTETDGETFKVFQEYIDRENRFVLAKWRDSKKAVFEDNDVLQELELNDPIDDILL